MHLRHHAPPVFGIHPLCQGGGADNIGEQDGEDAALFTGARFLMRAYRGKLRFKRRDLRSQRSRRRHDDRLAQQVAL